VAQVPLIEQARQRAEEIRGRAQEIRGRVRARVEEIRKKVQERPLLGGQGLLVGKGILGGQEAIVDRFPILKEVRARGVIPTLRARLRLPTPRAKIISPGKTIEPPEKVPPRPRRTASISA